MRYLWSYFLKSNIKNYKPVFSYGKFLRDNPNANKKERLIAIKRFLDSTR